MLIGETSKKYLNQLNFKEKLLEFNLSLESRPKISESVKDLLFVTMGCLDKAAYIIINSDSKENDKKEYVDSEGIRDKLNDISESIYFSSLFFDYLISSESCEKNEKDHFFLLGAVSYFFCDYIGSSRLMINSIRNPNVLKESEYEEAIYQVLSGKGNYDEVKKYNNRIIKKSLCSFKEFEENGSSPNFKEFEELYNTALFEEDPMDFFLCELLLALIKLKILNSTRFLLPGYTKISPERWNKEFSSNCKVTELWPSQRKLGENGIFDGKSGVIQMPTSSGKTTSICILLQALFINKPGSIAIIVAPFRSLCRQTCNDISNFFKNYKDMQINEIFDLPEERTFEFSPSCIYVLTPEKLLFLLKQDPNMLTNIATIIFDEADLFDDPQRGTLYELLIATVKDHIYSDTQIVLISAVLPNAKDIKDWILGSDKGVLITDDSIKSTQKSIAVNKISNKNNLELVYIDTDNPNKNLFSIPRIIKFKLLKEKRGKKIYFPDVSSSRDLSIYYSNELIHNGAVSIFCGQKRSVHKIIERIVDLSKLYDLSTLKEVCDKNEKKKLKNLILENFGEKSMYVSGAELGVFPHHAGIPTGIQSSIEYALSKKLISFVVCTSTLEKGMNLPIKYLIVSQIYQAGSKVSVRDFKNLIGRTGRSGKYIEGSIILCASVKNHSNNKSWMRYMKSLNSSDGSDYCLSNILTLFKDHPFISNKKIFNAIKGKYDGTGTYDKQMSKIRDLYIENGGKDYYFRKLKKSIDQTLIAIESYVSSYIFENKDIKKEEITKIAENTLGYFQADNENDKTKMIKLFEVIYNYINELPSEQLKSLSKITIGISSGLKISNWIQDHLEIINKVNNEDDIIDAIFPLAIELTNSNIVTKIKDSEDFDKLKKLFYLWIQGVGYYDILKHSDLKIVKRKNSEPKDLSIEDIIDICDDLFSYEVSNVFSAIQIFLEKQTNFSHQQLFTLLHEKTKYGLPDQQTIFIYKIGFNDRHVAQLISENIPKVINSKSRIKKYISWKKSEFKNLLESYPSYFTHVIKNL